MQLLLGPLRRHPAFAHQEAPESGPAQSRHVGRTAQAALADAYGVGQPRRQAERRGYVRAKRVQVAVVDPDGTDARADMAQFLFVVHLEQDVKPQAAGRRCQVAAGVRSEAGGNEQYGVGPGFGCFENLVVVDDKFLAEHRQRRRSPARRMKPRQPPK